MFRLMNLFNLDMYMYMCMFARNLFLWGMHNLQQQYTFLLIVYSVFVHVEVLFLHNSRTTHSCMTTDLRRLL